MYESFFGLRARPFSLRPDPDFLYLSHQHSVALSMLEFSLTGQAGIVVVTGEIGSGKTTLIRHFLRQGEHSTIIGLISNTHAGMGEVLQWVLQALKIETKSMSKSIRHQALLKYLTQQATIGHQVVLIVDEAQNLSIAALEELRLLSNIDLDKDNTLQIVLVGQPELLEKLRRPELVQFSQRISVHYHLTPLTYPESCGYVRHRLAVAGARREVFDRLAMGAVYYFSGGIPRLMNSLCDMAMVYGYAAGRPAIDLDLVLTVVCDRERQGAQVLARSTADISRDALIEAIEQRFGEEQAEAADSEVALDPDEPESGHINGVRKEPIQVPHWPAENGSSTVPPFDASRADDGTGVAPPVGAIYLSDDVFYQELVEPRKPGAFRWLRRHLASNGNRS